MATYEDYMAQIAQNRTDVGQRIAGLPQFETNLREQVYGADQAIPSLRGQISDKVSALYDADKRMADVYANPASQMYMRDPYQREKAISTQEQLEVGQIGDLQNLLASRQDVLGSAIEKGLKIYQAGIEAAKFEQESLFAELDAAMKVAAAKRTAASSGSGTASQYKYTDLVKMLQSSGQLTPENYPNLRTDTGFLNWLQANPKADYEAAQTYLPDLVAYPKATTSASMLNYNADQSMNDALNKWMKDVIATPKEALETNGRQAVMSTGIQRYKALSDPTAQNAMIKFLDAYGVY